MIAVKSRIFPGCLMSIGNHWHKQTAACPQASIIRNPVIRQDCKSGLAVHFAGSCVALFYEKSKAPALRQKVLRKNCGHLCPDAKAAAVGPDINSAYLESCKRPGAGVDLPYNLAVQFSDKYLLTGKELL